MSRQVVIDSDGELVEECGVCSEEVVKGQDIVCCEAICARKFHISCAGLNTAAAELVDSYINISFVCSRCLVLTPKGLHGSIKDLSNRIALNDGKLQKNTDEMVRKQENLNQSIKLYMKDILDDVRSNKNAIGKITNAMKTLFDSCNEDKKTLAMITSYLKEEGKIAESVNERIDREVKQMSNFCEKQFGDFNSTLESMTEVTTTLIEIGLQRYHELLNDVKSKFKVKARRHKRVAKKVQKQLSQRPTGNSKKILKRVSAYRNEDADSQMVKKRKSSDKEGEKNLIEVSEEENEGLIEKIQRMESWMVSQAFSQQEAVRIQNLTEKDKKQTPKSEKVNPSSKEINEVSGLENKKRDKKSKKKIEILEDTVVSELDSVINRQIYEYNKSVELTNRFIEEQAQSIKPQVKIIGMTIKHESLVLERSIKNQNKTLENAELKIIKIEESKIRNGEFFAILEMDFESFQKAIQLRRINVGWDRCSIIENVNLVRCYKCSGYNHTSFRCLNQQACSKCAGNHSFKDCMSSIVSCVNCKKANGRLKLGLEVEHHAWSNRCGVYQQKLLLQRKRLSYNK